MLNETNSLSHRFHTEWNSFSWDLWGFAADKLLSRTEEQKDEIHIRETTQATGAIASFLHNRSSSETDRQPDSPRQRGRGRGRVESEVERDTHRDTKRERERIVVCLGQNKQNYRKQTARKFTTLQCFFLFVFRWCCRYQKWLFTFEHLLSARKQNAILLLKGHFLGDLRWIARFEPNRCEPNQSTYRQPLPKVCQQQFHSQDENDLGPFGLFWFILGWG